MAGRSKVTLLAAIVMSTLMQSSTAQTTHVVGGSLTWAIPPGGNSTFYSAWAAEESFRVGDTLVFNFVSSQHDVAQVTKADFDNCNTSSPISLTTTSPARITLNASGEQYFFCRFPGHCVAGQKLAINVSTAGSSPAPPTSAPATTPVSTSNPPTTSIATSPSSNGTPPSSVIAPSPPNSAASLPVSAIPSALLALYVAFLY